MKIESTLAAREEHVRFHTPHLPTLFILHITCTKNQTIFLCITLYAEYSTAQTWQALSKRREKASRHSLWFLPLGLTCRRSPISLQWCIITCTALTQIFCWIGMNGLTFHLVRARAATPSSKQRWKPSLGYPKLLLGLNSCLFKQWLSYLLPGRTTPVQY